jgi:hypothetical protein
LDSKAIPPSGVLVLVGYMVGRSELGQRLCIDGIRFELLQQRRSLLVGHVLHL